MGQNGRWSYMWVDLCLHEKTHILKVDNGSNFYLREFLRAVVLIRSRKS